MERYEDPTKRTSCSVGEKHSRIQQNESLSAGVRQVLDMFGRAQWHGLNNEQF